MRYLLIIFFVIFSSCDVTNSIELTIDDVESIHILNVDVGINTFNVIEVIESDKITSDTKYNFKGILKHPMKFTGSFYYIEPDTLELIEVLSIRISP